MDRPFAGSAPTDGQTFCGILRSGNGTAPPTDGQASTRCLRFHGSRQSSRQWDRPFRGMGQPRRGSDNGTGLLSVVLFHRARTRFQTVGQTSSPRPLRRAVAGPTDDTPLSDRPFLSVANLAVVRGSRLSARPFLHGRGKEPLTEGQTFSRVPDNRTDLFAGWAKPDGVAGSCTPQRDRPFRYVVRFFSRTRFQTVGQTSSPRDGDPTMGQAFCRCSRSPTPPCFAVRDYRPDLFTRDLLSMGGERNR
jgi:hypothetical protein